MELIERARKRFRLWYHKKEIHEGLQTYKKLTRQSPDEKQLFADAGTFKEQLERLYCMGNAAETGELKRLAMAAVTVCLANRFYKPTDFLSDILLGLEKQTYFTPEPEGEPPLTQGDAFQRKSKLQTSLAAYLVPFKVAAIETILRHCHEVIGSKLPYQKFARFERSIAKIYALLGESETKYVETGIKEFLDRWVADAGLRKLYPEPAKAMLRVVNVLLGAEPVDEASTLRLMKPGLPFRLSTLVPENRQNLIQAALQKLDPSPHT